jgi:hypothetical protein
MENLLFYSLRYLEVKSFESYDKVKLQQLIQPISFSVDTYVEEKLITLLKEREYQNIFIPLSPFYAFSDYLGLQLALLLKLSDTPNRLTNIFIYGTELYGDVFKNPYFQVTQFSEVNLIDFSKEAIEACLDTPPLTTQAQWKAQLDQINIAVPDNYYDNHSIANEWGVYQLARNADIPIGEITDLDKDKFNSLYFKWLIAKNALYEDIPEEQKIKQREYTQKLETNLKFTGQTIDVSKFAKKKK